ncbi:MAG: gamma-glutamylcyclotransferase [Candidatus Marinimicrobia bacterium]|nr:gamma-glutamylcyclotransferase [Candidatus Neomarinimicrobiota bacterium]
MVYYFAYGSNMDICQTKNRVGNFKIIRKAVLNEYSLKFNKKSNNGSGKANIVVDENSKVEGVVFEFTESQLKTMDCFEKGYQRSRPINVLTDGISQKAVTYIADSKNIDNNLLPTEDYLKIIKDAAKMIGLSDSYQRHLKSFQTEEERNGL